MVEIKRHEPYPGCFVYSAPKPFSKTFSAPELAERFWNRGQYALDTYGAFTSWGGLSMYVNELNYEQHGYWDDSKFSKDRPLDKERLNIAKTVAQYAQPGDVRHYIEEVPSNRDEKLFYFEFWDEANPWCLPWTSLLQIASYEKAEKYVQRELANHTRLHNGVIEAFIWYRETGEATLPTWIPDGGLMAYDSEGKKFKRYTRCPGIRQLPNFK